MTGTFSTMINFSLLGMTQRLHKLSIKEVLQSQSEAEKHNIRFPRLEAHHKKNWTWPAKSTIILSSHR